jgi:hypothetical protein
MVDVELRSGAFSLAHMRYHAQEYTQNAFIDVVKVHQQPPSRHPDHKWCAARTHAQKGLLLLCDTHATPYMCLIPVAVAVIVLIAGKVARLSSFAGRIA